MPSAQMPALCIWNEKARGDCLMPVSLARPPKRSNTPMPPSHEPIAITGIGCRFPCGSDSPEAFWALMTEGRDGIVDVPEDRWSIDRFYDPDPNVPGKMYVRKGGFLTQPIDRF